MSLLVYWLEVCRCLIMIILLFAATGKTLNFSLFRKNLVESFHVPQQWSVVVALCVIILEWLLMLLIVNNGAFLYQSVFVVMCLFIGFTLIISYLLIKEQLVRCNCFGQSDDKISYYDVVQNLLIILACIFFLSYEGELQTGTELSWLAAINSLAIFVVITHLNYIALVMRNPKEAN